MITTLLIIPPYTCRSVIHCPKKGKHKIKLNRNTTDIIIFSPKISIYRCCSNIFHVNYFTAQWMSEIVKAIIIMYIMNEWWTIMLHDAHTLTHGCYSSLQQKPSTQWKKLIVTANCCQCKHPLTPDSQS